MWYCCPNCGIAAGYHGLEEGSTVHPDGMVTRDATGVSGDTAGASGSGTPETGHDRQARDSQRPLSITPGHGSRVMGVKSYASVIAAMLTTWVVVVFRDIPRDEYLTDWTICNGLVAATALVVPVFGPLGRATLGLWPAHRSVSDMRLNASAMSRLVGSVMGFRRGDLLDLWILSVFLLPLSVLTWFHNGYVQLYVVFALLLVVAWLECVNVVFTHVGFDRVGVSMLDASHTYAIRGAHLAAIALWRSVDSKFDVDIRTYAPAIFAWALLTTILALLSRFISIRRLPDLEATVSLEAKKRDAYILNGRQFEKGEEAPRGFSAEQSLKAASDRELSQMWFLPLWLVVGGILVAVGCCVLFVRFVGELFPDFFSLILARVIVAGGFAVIAGGLLASSARREVIELGYTEIP